MLTNEDLQKIQKIIRPLETDIKKIRKDLNLMISFFDHEYLKLEKRVTKIEKHLHLSSLT